ncbi:unnamed protein product [Protopolystoma xenopodis]|uniref:Uncharacterized protein n=1 Tax=Protopolystoma xenopodis TaxID=117903 RepID=A0A3S5AWA2_9PLAT|nr:unnamed protein product [Protopolystoma xenopodis]
MLFCSQGFSHGAPVACVDEDQLFVTAEHATVAHSPLVMRPHGKPHCTPAGQVRVPLERPTDVRNIEGKSIFCFLYNTMLRLLTLP